MKSLSDEQWLVLDLLMRARQKGVKSLNRLELLESEAVPVGVRVKLTMAALLMPKELVNWTSQHNFEVTQAGVDLFNAMFKKPTPVGDVVICLPDQTAVTH